MRQFRVRIDSIGERKARGSRDTFANEMHRYLRCYYENWSFKMRNTGLKMLLGSLQSGL